MIRLVLLPLILLSQLSFAQGNEALSGLLAKMIQQNRLQQAATAYAFCEQTLKSWPSPTYATTIKTLGQLWQRAPDASYKVLNACQSLWMNRYFSPLRSQNAGSLDESSWFAPAFNMIRSAGYLREEIYAFSYLKRTSGKIPPAPFELLTGMSSSQRQLDEILHREMRSSVQNLSALGGAMGSVLLRSRDFAGLVGEASVSAGRVHKYAFAAAILAMGAGSALDYGLWKMRDNDLSGRFQMLQIKLQTSAAPRAVLVDEYLATAKQFGYFLTYDVYLQDSQMERDTPAQPKECTKALTPYYEELARFGRADLKRFVTSADCADASVLWLEAADFLTAKFPGDAKSLSAANLLRESAMLTYQSYESARAYFATLPVCTPSPSSNPLFQRVMECVDPESGNSIL